MKRYAFILLVLLSAGAVRAQRYEKNILGVRAGLNLSSYSISESGVSVSTDSRAAFHVAVSDQILLCDRLPFYLETGLAFSSRGGKLSGVSFRPSYLQIPVLVNYHFNIKDIVTIQPFAGLYYGLGIGGKMKANGEKDDIFGDDGMLKRSDLGVRLGAGVVAGMGFIGAGTIIVTRRQRVKGLTTAAGLWTVAVVGLAIGAGFYEGGLLTTVLILLAEMLFSKLEYHIMATAPEINLFIEYEDGSAVEHGR